MLAKLHQTRTIPLAQDDSTFGDLLVASFKYFLHNSGQFQGGEVLLLRTTLISRPRMSQYTVNLLNLQLLDSRGVLNGSPRYRTNGFNLEVCHVMMKID